MANSSFLSDMMARVAQSGWRRRARAGDTGDTFDLFQRLLGDEGEASGLVTAMQALAQFEAHSPEDKKRLFVKIAEECSVDDTALAKAIAEYTPGDADAARRIHYVAEPRSLELIRRLNRVPGATARLVDMRADLLSALRDTPALKGLDMDFQHLFASWFNRGFLEIRKIDWHTPADILEKIITYEAVHEINGWDDLRQRVADPDRRLFAFFHPAMPSDPLIFVEVALTRVIPAAIDAIIRSDRDRISPTEATTAVFYSISNCQKGLRGVSFGNFLIKQVVAELQAELSNLKTFVTLSPVPGLRKWAESRPDMLTPEDLAAIDQEDGPSFDDARRIAARYLLRARRPHGSAHDPVAHFHLGNGATLHRVHAAADLSPNGRANSWGVMVNYLYDGSSIEANHQAYATDHTISASAEVRKLAD